jgi:hypothetical protein
MSYMVFFITVCTNSNQSIRCYICKEKKLIFDICGLAEVFKSANHKKNGSSNRKSATNAKSAK